MDDTKLQELAAKTQVEINAHEAESKALETRMWQLQLVSRSGKIPKPRGAWHSYITGKKLCPSCGTRLLTSGWGYPSGLVTIGIPLSFYYRCPKCDYEFMS